MKRQIKFTKKSPYKILEQNKASILDFQNLYSVYLFNKEPKFQKAISSPDNFVFPDGRVLSFFLKSKQIRGPTFTRNFFENNLEKQQKHFFILANTKDMEQLVKKFPKLKSSKAHSPPYIQNIEFSKKEINKMANKITKFKPDYVWVGIGNPKQEILANQLYKKYTTNYINIGAALDFLIGKKKEAPKIFTTIGLEWLYRLATDFKYSKKKVRRSLIALKYLGNIKIE